MLLSYEFILPMPLKMFGIRKESGVTREDWILNGERRSFRLEQAKRAGLLVKIQQLAIVIHHDASPEWH